MTDIINISKHPFAQYSAEEEENLEAIYFEQQNYKEIIELSKAGVSRFILGQRGQGKSAMIHHLINDLKKSQILPVLITRYDDFPERDNKAFFLYSMIQNTVFAIAKHMYENPKSFKKLNTTQRNELGMLIQALYDPLLADDFVDKSRTIKEIRKVNFWKRLWNRIGVGVANKTLTTVTQITAQIIQSYTGTIPDFSIADGEYFHGIKLSEIHKMSKKDFVSLPIESLIKIIRNLIITSSNLGYNSLVVLYDQIDEVRSVNSDVKKVADFLADFLQDTEFLYTKNLSIVISLWSEARNLLNNRNIRFDKFKEIDIRWRKDELIKLLDKRLLYYSDDKQHPVTFNSLIPDEQYQNIVLDLAAGSPRALLTLMSYIQSEEISVEPVKEFSPTAISNGSMIFCKKFDYVSLQPSRTGLGKDLKSWINKILRMRLSIFSAKQYAEFYQDVPVRSVSKHIEQMVKLNLIRDALLPSDDGEPRYQVVDPRIVHMLGRGVLEIE